MTTPTPPSRAGHDAAVIAYCQSRITLELEHGEIERYHRDDCDALAGSHIYDCDCDGPERLEAMLRGDLQVLGILEQWSVVELSASMRQMLDAIAAQFASRPDFPVWP